MPKSAEIRESIELGDIFLRDGQPNIVQRMINLEPNMRHNMINCDMFLDNLFFDDRSAPWFGVVEVIVSPFPIIYTDMSIALYPNRSPVAATDFVLFKAILNGGVDKFGPLQEGSQFPNRFATFNTDFAWYSPHLYITLNFHSGADVVLKDVAMSFLFSVAKTKISKLTSTLGAFAERQAMSIAAIAGMGRKIDSAYNVGSILPSWKWGGIRPEYMAKSDAFAEFFYKTSTQEAEKTVDPNNLRTFAKLARQMVENPLPFGTGGTIKGDVPDWFRFHLNEGIEAGAVRSQWPPIKHNDNGNVLML